MRAVAERGSGTVNASARLGDALATAQTVAARWALPAVVLLGLLLRAIPAIGHAWPVGDGGLFYTMVGELKANNFAIPATTAFDGRAIPFAYPPLALELTAMVERVTQLPRSELFIWLPLVFSTLCVPVVYLLSREVVADRTRAIFATLIYATFPYAWGWLTLGSGITRSLGMLFALLATWQGLRLFRDGRLSRAMATGVLAGLGALSHPEAGPFVAIGLGTGLLVNRSARNLWSVGLAGLVAALIVAPWLLVTIIQHGPGPFLSAAAVSRDPTASLVVYLFGFLLATPVPVAALLDYVGQVGSLVRRRPFLVIWRLAICFLDLRFALVAAVVPMSLLAANGLFDAVLPALRAAAGRLRPGSTSALAATVAVPGTRPQPSRTMVGLASVAIVVGSLVAPSVFLAPHVALANADIAALTWVRTTQPPNRPFVVLATSTWGSDDLSEWFPALSGHPSLATSQGLEWVDPAVRGAEAVAQDDLRRCQPANLPCLTRWLAVHGGVGTGVYVPAAGSSYAAGDDPSAAIRTELLASAAFEEAYAGPGANVFVLRN